MRMNSELLIKIAQKGYNVAYGANINFATYDIVKKIPGYVSFLSIIVGILGLVYPPFAEKYVSVFILILGIASVYIERFTPNIDSYSNRGIANTDQLNKLKNLYFEVKRMSDSADFSTIEARYTAIEDEFNASSQPDQIVFANWLAHYKMFCEKDMSWMDEQLHFHWWKDKIPMTAHIVIYILLLSIFVYYCVKIPVLNEFFCKIFYLQ
ncbi:SLATT domain-containing protein [Bacteroides fragilis]|jgi:hypothetical protein|uniref:SLATT domain-containing protein n=2 Tax=Bacteroides TaxID=816 RepID=A0A642EYC9_BACFG|nr:hypothetical protein M070_1111 [Bacteroides fragilis str. A7 (UDC12-2)]KAA4783444.1 SLATT domain-containing protein [Bacteroides fragilis]KAA4797025.1 SLATT domain-containing protein [Bacteroides fragilis]KAA4799405.1 SLATT domain-containing protein [Bacteroides fragilis]KAA4801552.1 SLATT domain-containing protein [Bacteroides fragilis]